MYIGKGSIENVLEWFQRPETTERLLCLFVAGELTDPTFFGELVDNKETIDVLSGSEIAIFLFTRNNEQPLEFLSQGGNRHYVCGQYIGSGSLRHKHISEIDVSPTVRAQITAEKSLGDNLW